MLIPLLMFAPGFINPGMMQSLLQCLSSTNRCRGLFASSDNTDTTLSEALLSCHTDLFVARQILAGIFLPFILHATGALAARAPVTYRCKLPGIRPLAAFSQPELFWAKRTSSFTPQVRCARAHPGCQWRRKCFLPVSSKGVPGGLSNTRNGKVNSVRA